MRVRREVRSVREGARAIGCDKSTVSRVPAQPQRLPRHHSRLHERLPCRWEAPVQSAGSDSWYGLGAKVAAGSNSGGCMFCDWQRGAQITSARAAGIEKID